MRALEDLEKIISAETLIDQGTPSASIAILEDGRLSARVITGGKEDTETVYQACSISKAITGLAVAKLIDQGHFTYDTCVAKHLPEKFRNAIAQPANVNFLDHVTVAILLSHTSGLSQHGFPGYAGNEPQIEDILSGKPPSNTPRVRFETFPGAHFSYSGGGLTVLQVFLEAIMKEAFPKLMRETVLQPLGMNRSHYGDLGAEEKNYAASYVTGHQPAKVEYHNLVEVAAAGLWTTPSDLMKAVSAIQESIYSDSGFLTTARARQMITAHIKNAPYGDMALGWFVSEDGFAHGGSNEPGYRCFVVGTHHNSGANSTAGINDATNGAAGTNLRNGVAIMTNSALGTEAFARIIDAIYYSKDWARPIGFPSAFPTDMFPPYPAPTGTAIKKGWIDWIGTWDDKWRILDDQGVPKLAFGNSEALTLRPAAAPVRDFGDKGREFVLVVEGLRTGLRLSFENGERVIVLVIEGTAKQILKCQS